MTPTPTFTPTRAEIIGALSHIRYEIEALLQTPRHDPDDESIVETVYFRKMAHARALRTFFATPISRRDKDDALSEDYLFPAAPLYNADVARRLLDRFNKDLFHVSYSRVRRTPVEKAWPMKDFLPPVIDRCKKFITHLLELPWPDVPAEELQRWRDMQEVRFVFRNLAQSTSNIADAQIVSVESHVKGI